MIGLAIQLIRFNGNFMMTAGQVHGLGVTVSESISSIYPTNILFALNVLCI